MIQTFIYYCAPSHQPVWFSRWTFHLRTLFRFRTSVLGIVVLAAGILATYGRAQEIVAVGGGYRFSSLDAADSYVQAGCSAYHTLAIKTDGTATAWGRNYDGECQIPNLPAGVTWTQMSASYQQSAGVRSDGQIMVWGVMTFGLSAVPALPPSVGYVEAQLANGHAVALRTDGNVVAWGGNILYSGIASIPALPVNVHYVQVVTGDVAAAARRSNGSIVVWGNPSTSGIASVPTLPAGVTYVDVSLGYSSAAAVRSDGSIVVWGIGGPALTAAVPPRPLGTSYTKVAYGIYGMLALRNDGVIVTWGGNVPPLPPAPPLPPNLTYSTFAHGGNHALAIRSDGSLVTWGKNDLFQGNIPRRPAGLQYVDLAIGGSHGLALVSDGSIVAFGSNASGESTVPILPAGVTYTRIDAAANRSVALRSDGLIESWGQNAYGQNVVPAAPAGEVYTDVSTSFSHVLALTSSGNIVAWGLGTYGQTTVPVLPAGLTYTSISAGRSGSAAIRSDGTCVAWGSPSFAFNALLGLPIGLTFDQVAVGYDHGIARLSNRSTFAWGSNAYNQLNVPSIPVGMTFQDVDAGDYRSVASRSDGSILTWGGNSVLGAPSLPGGYVPTKVRVDQGPAVALILPPPLPGSILLTAPPTVGLGTPWAVNLTSTHANTPYMLDLSFAGSWPGVPIGPTLVFPLNRPFVNFDYGASLSAAFPGIFTGFIGTTDAAGVASPIFNIPVVPSLVGTRFWAAAATFGSTSLVGVNGISNAIDATLTQALPVVTAIAPVTGPAAGGYTMSLHGSNLTANSSVTIGGVAATNVTFVTPSLMTCTVPSGTVGTRDVVIHVGATSLQLPGAFAYVQNLSMVSIAPALAVPGTMVTVTGTGLPANIVLTVGGIPTPVITANGSFLTFIAPTLPACAGVVIGTNAGGQTATITYGPVPVVVGAFFAAGPVTGGGSFSIIGYNFQPGTKVAIGGTLATIISMTPGLPSSSGTITVVAPPAAQPGTQVITVTSAAGCAASGNHVYTYF